LNRKRAWLLNFDADEELARPAGYTPARAVAERARALAARVGPLLGPEDMLLTGEEGAAPPLGTCVEGRAWCPTPRALRQLRRAGAEPAPVPPLDVLRRANHRRLCAELGQPLPGARYVTTLVELEATITGPSPSGQWLLKRPFGFAGRGRRRVSAGALDPAARAWVAATLSVGEGLQVEPWLERRGDFCLHGHVSARGAVCLGAPCAQRCDERGAWLEARRAEAGEIDREELARLAEAALEAGRALAAIAYFGPFGIDAFRWADGAGRTRFNPRCEINARYTMGWATGMGGLRPDLE
jgi:hypothetical protein